jgi:hypothetical protein
VKRHAVLLPTITALAAGDLGARRGSTGGGCVVLGHAAAAPSTGLPAPVMSEEDR